MKTDTEKLIALRTIAALVGYKLDTRTPETCERCQMLLAKALAETIPGAGEPSDETVLNTIELIMSQPRGNA
jgi:hypothetical protein